MKIGVLTFHRAYNYGAFLQCYSLVTNIKRAFPDATVEVIDYMSENMSAYYKTDLLSLAWGRSTSNTPLSLRMHLSRLKQFCLRVKSDSTYVSQLKARNECFEKALSRLPLSKESIVSDDYDKSISFLNSLGYDVIVVGSDAVWNDYQTNIPSIYYLDSKIDAKKLSYAASSFGMDFKVKSADELKEIGEKMKGFDFIGVRDCATEEYVSLAAPEKEFSHTCDPSVVLDLNDEVFDDKAVKQKLIAAGIDLNKPVYGIMGADWLGKIARDVIGEDAQLVAIYSANKYANCYIADLSPFEWAKIFSFFTMTFTHFFHGTLFSLRNGTPTMSIDWSNDYSKKYDTKIKDVLKRLGLSDYHFSKEFAEENLDKLREHYNKVMKNMQTEKERIGAAINVEKETFSRFCDALSNIIKEK